MADITQRSMNKGIIFCKRKHNSRRNADQGNCDVYVNRYTEPGRRLILVPPGNLKNKINDYRSKGISDCRTPVSKYCRLVFKCSKISDIIRYGQNNPHNTCHEKVGKNIFWESSICTDKNQQNYRNNG